MTTAMHSDIEQALAELDMHNLIDGDTGSECDCGDWEMYDAGQPPTFNDHVRSAILAHPAMQAIARQAAIVAAVERLGDDWWMEHGNGCYSVTVMRAGVPMDFTADTLPAAITAALEGER